MGKELSESVQAVFAAVKAPVDWEQFDLTGHVSSNDALMKDTLASLRRNKVGLKGTLYTPVSRMGHASFNVSMRKVCNKGGVGIILQGANDKDHA